ncbi:sensor histidine kinase [Streptomyces sp. NPDC006879]|uniref:sensor histidine kinase n=1 Tax=Streptomyces sp. NPDC006879 TaxID=3364767 RepID=UPI0036869F7D
MRLPKPPRATELLRAPLGWWDARQDFGKDALLALALTAPAGVPVLSKLGAQIGDLPQRPVDLLGVGLTLAQTLPLAFRRRWPAAVLAVVGAAFAVHQVLGFATTFASLGLYLSLYSAGAHQSRLRGGTVAAACAGYVVMATVLNRLGSPQGFADYVAFGLGLCAAWLVGSGVRRGRMAEAERRRLAGEVAAAEERARIARELHDVVTHHVTAMVVQADAAQFLLDSAPARAGAGLAAVSDTGRRALTELRYLLGVLEATGNPTSAPGAVAEVDRAPTLGKLGDLVARARAAGQPVEFTEDGERRPQAVDVELAGYRVVQEALTNAMKHAAGQSTRVRVRYGPARTEIEVVTKGTARTVEAGAPAGGRGLAGLRERVRTVDGELVAGPRPGGGFGVRAVIPTEPAQELRP